MPRLDPLARDSRLALVLVLGLPLASAQVVLDGTLGPSGPLGGPNYDIGAGLGTTRGNNVFQSFAQFDLKAGEVATFSGPANIQNILSRVTGGQASTIDGTVRSSVPGANLFLINPSGLLFGPNAVVDVSGSFAASTANYLKLADGARFVAALDADDSVLSTAPVAAFGFLDGASGGIEVRGALHAAPGASLSVVGSAVSVAEGARLEAANGPISLVGVSAPGELPFPPSASSASDGLGAQPTAAPPANGGGVVIRGGRLVVENALISASTGGGDVDLVLTESLEVRNGGQIITSSSGADQGGDIVLHSPSILIDGQDGPAPTRIAAETWSEDPEAAGGDILVESHAVALLRGAEISVSAFGAADAGRVEIATSSLLIQGSEMPQFPTQISANASPTIGSVGGAGGLISIQADSVEIGNGAGILAATTGDADAGSISVEAGSLTLNNGGITTFTAGAGHGGGIQVTGETITLDGPFASITALTTGLDDQSPAGNGGVITLTGGSLELRNDAAISATTFGDGQGGNINITADSLVLDTATFQPGSIPGIAAASEPSFFGEGGGGRGGDIAIVTGSLTLRHGMLISTTTATSGDGGAVDIRADTVDLESRSSIQSASLAAGTAGTLSLRSAGPVLLTGGSTISTSAPESSGGDIQLTAGGDVQLFDSQITAQAGPGGGGNITLTAPSLVYLLHSTLTAQAAGDGGNLAVIDPTFFILNDAALISKSSSANGGNITILSDYFFVSSSVIDASAPFGLPGTVSVSAPEVDLSGSLVQLPGNLLGAESQLRPDCAVRVTGDVSTFVLLGRGGLPIEPGGYVPSALVLPRNEAP